MGFLFQTLHMLLRELHQRFRPYGDLFEMGILNFRPICPEEETAQVRPAKKVTSKDILSGDL